MAVEIVHFVIKNIQIAFSFSSDGSDSLRILVRLSGDRLCGNRLCGRHDSITMPIDCPVREEVVACTPLHGPEQLSIGVSYNRGQGRISGSNLKLLRHVSV